MEIKITINKKEFGVGITGEFPISIENELDDFINVVQEKWREKFLRNIKTDEDILDKVLIDGTDTSKKYNGDVQPLKEEINVKTNVTRKICKKCKISKSADCFNKNNKAKDGLQGWCKDCYHDFWKKRSNKYKEKQKKKQVTNKDITIDTRKRISLTDTTNDMIPAMHEWTAEQENILRDNYFKKDVDILNLLPGFTEKQIKQKAKEMNMIW